MTPARRLAAALALIALGAAGASVLTLPDAAARQNAAVQAGASDQPLTTMDISQAQAMAAVHAAMRKADEIGIKQNVAVVDAGGNLKAFARMDGAWIGSIDIAVKKAKTARYFDMPTGEIGKLSQPGGPLYMIEVSNDGLVSFPGGLPIKADDGTVIGAIGSSGSTVENDKTVAQAGVDALK